MIPRDIQETIRKMSKSYLNDLEEWNAPWSYYAAAYVCRMCNAVSKDFKHLVHSPDCAYKEELDAVERALSYIEREASNE